MANLDDLMRLGDPDDIRTAITRLTAERDEWKGKAEEAQGVSVWAVQNRIAFTDSMVGGPHLMIAGARIKVDSTDADIYRALLEASKGE